jgi:hypothetical protein
MAGEIYGFGIKVNDDGSIAIDKIDASLINLQSHAEGAKSQFGDIFKGFFGAEMAMKGLGMLKEGIRSVIETGAEMEQTHLAFEVMLGSAEKGEHMAESLKKWSDATPFDLKSVDEAGKLLLNYGVDANKILPDLKMLGDVSTGNKEKFQQLAMAFGRVASSGKTDGRTIREMIIAGFNPLKEYEKMTGKPMAKGMELSLAQLTEVLKHATSEGGKFFHMMDKQAQTVGGLFSTLKAHVQGMEFGAFQRLEPMLKGITIAATGVVDVFAKWLTPKHSEQLSEEKEKMNLIFEALKDGNIPTAVRKDLIDQLNTKFPDYIKNLVKEGDSLSIIAEKQKAANKAMDESITIAANKEELKTIREQKENLFKQTVNEKLKFDKMKKHMAEITPDVYFGSVETKEYWQTHLNKATLANKEIQDLINKFPSKANPYNEAEDMDKARDVLKQAEKYDAVRKRYENMANYDKYFMKNHPGIDIDDLGGETGNKVPSDMSDIEMGAHGGLGQSKQINIRVDKLLQVETKQMDNMSHQDLTNIAEQTIDLLVREVHNQMIGAGEM